MTVTYRTGYGTRRRTLTELYAWSEFAGCHSELQQRLIAWMDACRAHGLDVGIGEGIRTTAEQEAVFYDRHHVVASGGCCAYLGKRYSLDPAEAHVAPPGKSYHEPVQNGKCFAVDTVGHGYTSETLLAAYGLRSFASLSGAQKEAWHVQFIEIPTSRSSYNPTVHVIKDWKFPASAQPDPDYPKPTLRDGSSGAEVIELQQHCTWWGWYGSAIDGKFGAMTAAAVKKMQAKLNQVQDGVYGPVTAGAYLNWLKALRGMA